MKKAAFEWLGIAVLAACLGGCGVGDPYDPLMGPRNPRPGAERYLSTRIDLSEAQKKCLLDYAPCDEDTLTRLIEVPSREVRSLVAANPGVTSSILERLKNDPQAGVRQYVASNPLTPRGIIEELATDRDENVRAQIARRLSGRT